MTGHAGGRRSAIGFGPGPGGQDDTIWRLRGLRPIDVVNSRGTAQGKTTQKTQRRDISWRGTGMTRGVRVMKAYKESSGWYPTHDTTLTLQSHQPHRYPAEEQQHHTSPKVDQKELATPDCSTQRSEVGACDGERLHERLHGDVGMTRRPADQRRGRGSCPCHNVPRNVLICASFKTPTNLFTGAPFLKATTVGRAEILY